MNKSLNRTERIINKCFDSNSSQNSNNNNIINNSNNNRVCRHLSQNSNHWHNCCPNRCQSSDSSSVRNNSISGQTRHSSQQQLFNTQSVFKSMSDSQQFMSISSNNTSNIGLSNKEFISQMLNSNKDKELIERVDKYLTKFDQILIQINSKDVSKETQNIIKECFESEVQKKLNQMTEDFERTKNENFSLREELIRIKTEREIRDLAISSIDEEKQQFIHQLNDLKKQLIDCLPKNDLVFDTINSIINSNNESQKQLIAKFEPMTQRIEQLIHFNSNNNNNNNNNICHLIDINIDIGLEWFDNIA